MLKQEYLNTLSLEQASKEISEALIKERITLRDKITELEKLREKYQGDYLEANDGDSSENAPLEQAIQNLKVTTGDIVSATEKSQSLDRVEDADYVTAVFDYSLIITEVKNLEPESLSEFLKTFGITQPEEFANVIRTMDYNEVCDKIEQFEVYYIDKMTAIIEQDNPKDSPVWKSKNELAKVANSLVSQGVLSQEHYVLILLNDVKKMKKVRPYNCCGRVVVYSTVRLRLGDQRMFTYKIYPKGLSFIDNGIMAANSRLATALLGRYKGETVRVRGLSGSQQVLNYEIVDLY